MDYEAAWDRYYELADRRHREGLVFDQVVEVVDAAVSTAPRVWWCKYRQEGTPRGDTWRPSCESHVGCGWRLLVTPPGDDE